MRHPSSICSDTRAKLSDRSFFILKDQIEVRPVLLKIKALGLREDAATITASIGAATFAGLSWFYNSPVFGIVFGLLVGALITQFTQSRIWKKTVNRDFALKNIDTIYNPLFKEISRTIDQAKSIGYWTGYSAFPNNDWIQISHEAYFQFVPFQLRKQLNQFYSHVIRYNDLIGGAQKAVMDLVLIQASQFYNNQVRGVTYVVTAEVTADPPSVQGFMALTNPLLFGVHPREVLARAYPNSKTLTFRVAYDFYEPPRGIHSKTLEGPEELHRFDRLYEALLKQTQEIDSVKGLATEFQEIRREGRKVRSSLLEKVGETWLVKPESPI